MFAAEFEPAEPNGRRRSPRAPVSLDAHIGKAARTLCRWSISRSTAFACNLFRAGQGQHDLADLARSGTIAADVMWSDDYLAGCQFKKPLEIDVFDRLLAQNR